MTSLTLPDFQRLMRPLRNKIFLLLGRAILALVNNAGGTQKLQITALENEIITDVERFQEYGVETYPHDGAEVFAGFLNGNRDLGIILCVHDRRYRPTDLVEGEICLYTDEDKTTPFRFQLKRSRIAFLRADQSIEEIDTCKIIVSPKIQLGSATWGDLRRFVDERFQALFNAHVHSGIEPGNGNTGAPTASITDDHMTNVTRGI